MVDVVMVELDLQVCLVELIDFMDLGEVKMGMIVLVEEDWVDNWKKYYEFVCIIYDLIIVLLWIDYEVIVGEKIIKLDFGMVFGMGIYLIIKMSFFVLEQVFCGGEIVLDVGIGLGVFFIVSLLLGVKEIFVYDLDDVVVCVVQENIEFNFGMENIYVAVGDLFKGVEIEVDVIVVNILVDIFIYLIDDVY